MELQTTYIKQQYVYMKNTACLTSVWLYYGNYNEIEFIFYFPNFVVCNILY
jgi:hypothetical protein